MEVRLFILNNRKVIFLDRDGVINRRTLPHNYIVSWEEFQVLPKVYEAIRQCNKAGYYVVVVTNQRGIARGICTRTQIDLLHGKMIQDFKNRDATIDKVYICPHNNGECDCRKPKPGLLYTAETDLWNERKERVAKAYSWMIGDSLSDINAGKEYGVKTIWINSMRSAVMVEADYIAKNLYEAVDFLIQNRERLE